MEIYFIDDVPKVLALGYKYTRFRKNCQEINFEELPGSTFYIGDASTYIEAIESIKHRSKLCKNNTTVSNPSVHEVLVQATVLFVRDYVDASRGDGFLLHMHPFSEWCTLLEENGGYTIPEEYR